MESYKYEISEGDMGSIFSILRDRLYSNKHLAVLREYACNAVDAHRDAGIPDKPIRVDLPDSDNLFLRIRDYGKGLSPDDVINIFRKYGKSTKKDVSGMVGYFGIGAKSGHAYSPTFEIHSHHAGVKTTYRSELDASNVGRIVKLGSEPTGESGVEIIVPVQDRDIYRFRQEAFKLFVHFDPLPVIDLDLDHYKQDRQYKTEHGFLTRYRSEANYDELTAVVGTVPYRVDPKRCSLMVPRNLQYQYKTLYFPLGTVDVSPNREELEYTDRTIQAVKDKFQAFLNGCESVVLASLDSMKSGYDRRQTILSFMAETGIEIKDPRYASFGKEHVYLTAHQGGNMVKGLVMADGSPAWMTMIRPVKMSKRVMLDPVNYLTIKDGSGIYISTSPVKGIRWRHYDWRESFRVICPMSPLKSQREIDQFTDRVSEYLESHSLDGIHIAMLDSIRRPPEVIQRSEADRNRGKSNFLEFRNGSWEAADPDDLGEIDFYFPVFRFSVFGGATCHHIDQLHALARACGYEVAESKYYGVKVDGSGKPKEEMDIPSADQYAQQWLQQLRSDPLIHERFYNRAVLSKLTLTMQRYTHWQYGKFFESLPLEHELRRMWQWARLVDTANKPVNHDEKYLVNFYYEYVVDERSLSAEVDALQKHEESIVKKYPMLEKMMGSSYEQNHAGRKESNKQFRDFLVAIHQPEEYNFGCPDGMSLTGLTPTCAGEMANEDQWTRRKCHEK